MGKEKTQMTWKEIDGWFDFQDVYDMALENAYNGYRILEIGCYLGKSTAYMCEKIREKGKVVHFWVCDNFVGEKGYYNNELQYRFTDNMKACGFESTKDYTLFNNSSADLKRFIGDLKFDFVFIDGDHSYEGCLNDILMFRDNIQAGGIIAGHDYHTAEGVKKAVNEVFGEKNITIIGNSWIGKKLN